MIEIMTDLPANVIGFSGRGKITAQDYESRIVPVVEAALRNSPKLRLLYHLGPEAEGFEAGALWEDAKVGLGHLAAWERIALVTDIDWLRLAAKAFGFAMPGEVRVFGNAELGQARDWLTASVV